VTRHVRGRPHTRFVVSVVTAVFVGVVDQVIVLPRTSGDGLRQAEALVSYKLDPRNATSSFGRERDSRSRCLREQKKQRRRSARLDRWYSCSSAWNKPIPANPPIRPDSALMASRWVPQGSNWWNKNWLLIQNADSIAYPSRSTPFVTVQFNYPSCNAGRMRARIPKGTYVAPSTESENYLVLKLPNGDEIQFYDIEPPGATPFSKPYCRNPPPNSNWQALSAQVHHPGWTGQGNDTKGGDSGLNESAGAIRRRDLERTPRGGNWGHALGLSYYDICSRTAPRPGFVWPATHTDGDSSDDTCAPYGSHWQLDPSIHCSTWPSMAGKPEYLKQMCRTLQVYGALLNHQAPGQGDGSGIRAERSENFKDGYKYPWQNRSTGVWAGYMGGLMSLPPDLLSRFRVIDWTKWPGH